MGQSLFTGVLASARWLLASHKTQSEEWKWRAHVSKRQLLDCDALWGTLLLQVAQAKYQCKTSGTEVGIVNLLVALGVLSGMVARFPRTNVQ